MRPILGSGISCGLKIVLCGGLLVFSSGCATLAHRAVSVPFDLARNITRSPLLDIPLSLAEQGSHLVVDVTAEAAR